MRSKTVRLFISGVLAAALGIFGGAAQAIPVTLSFDPLLFAGVLGIDLGPGCLTPVDQVNTCSVDFLSVDFTDLNGNHFVTGTPFTDPAIQVQSVGDQFFALQATLTEPFLAQTATGPAATARRP